MIVETLMVKHNITFVQKINSADTWIVVVRKLIEVFLTNINLISVLFEIELIHLIFERLSMAIFIEMVKVNGFLNLLLL